MKRTWISRKGKRVLAGKKRSGPIALTLALVLLLGLFPTQRTLAEGVPTENKSQVVTPGGSLYYNADGSPATEEKYVVSTGKTISQVLGEENKFKVDLTVQTSTDYTSMGVDAAVTLVLDMSNSMESECINCGRTEEPPWMGGAYAKEVVHQKTASNAATYHPFKARIGVATDALNDFLAAYIADANGAKRYISLVEYSDYDKTKITNLTGGNGAGGWLELTAGNLAAVQATIKGLTCGDNTSTPRAMQLAKETLIGQYPPPITGQTSVILFTDGTPTSTISNLGGGDLDIPLETIPDVYRTKYAALKKMYHDPNDLRTERAYCNPAAYAFLLQDEGVPVYTISCVSGPTSPANAAWLASFSTGDTSYVASDAAKLAEALTELTQKISAKPDRVVDALPSYLTFGGFESGSPKSATETGGTITWSLPGCEPVTTDSNRSTYRLTYFVTLNNLREDFNVTRESHPVNAVPPTLYYGIYKDNLLDGTKRAVPFVVPAVKSFYSTLEFIKVDNNKKPISKTGEEGATFQLSCEVCNKVVKTVRNSSTGKVSLGDIPSGHTYTLVESKVPAGYVVNDVKYSVKVAWGALTHTLANDGKGNLVVVNQLDPLPKDLTVRKRWLDSGDTYKKLSITFGITGKVGEDVVVLEAKHTMNYSNKTEADDKVWELTLENLPTIDTGSGKAIHYSVREIDGEQFNPVCSEDEAVLVIQNTVPATRDITVKKVWIDPNPAPAVHPEVTIFLKVGGDEIGQRTLENGGESVTFENQPIWDDDGNEIKYTVTETIGPLPGGSNITYSPAVTGNAKTGFIVTNTFDSDKEITITVHKHWVGDSGESGKRPDSVIVELYADEKLVGTKTITRSDAPTDNPDLWVCSFGPVPRFSGSQEIAYTVKEPVVSEGYHSAVSGYEITNTAKTTSVTVHKSWVKPSSIVAPGVVFNLYQNGSTTLYKSGTLESGQSDLVFSNLPRADGDGKAYTYHVEEVTPAGYTSKPENGNTFINTINQVNDVTVTGSFLWQLREQPVTVLPESVTVQLYAGSTPVEGKSVAVKPTPEGKWEFSFTGLPRYTDNGGGVIAYSVRELDKDGAHAMDSSTIFFKGTDGEVHDFGAHYELVKKEGLNKFVCDILNHTDAESTNLYKSSIFTQYDYYLDGVKQSTGAGEPVEWTDNLTYFLEFATGDYTTYGGRTYAFQSGAIKINGAEVKKVTEGENEYLVNQPDNPCVVTLLYELHETSGGGYEPPPKPTPTPTPTPTPVPTPVPTPTPTPTSTPTPSPTPSPVPSPSTPPTTKPTPPPPLPEEVDRVVEDAKNYPEHIIRDKETLQDLYPELDIEDLPVPLFVGPDFAVIQTPDGNLVVIDLELVPLGALPQTGTTSVGTSGAAAVLFFFAALACTCAVPCAVLKKKFKRAAK